MEKINNVKVRPVKQNGDGDKLAKGYKLFDEPYANIFLLARKKSGKTTALFEILKRCTDNRTRIVIIASTIHKDNIYKEMVKYFKKKGNPMAIYTYLKTDGVSVIDYELDKLNKPDEQQEEGEITQDQPEEPKPKFLYFGKEEKQKELGEKVERPSKYQTPDLIFVLDDLGSGLRDKSVSDLLKKNRHYKSKVIMSSQYLNDLRPEAIKQLDYLLIFPGQSQDKMELVYKHLDLGYDLEYFIEKYHEATKEKFNFLYVDAVSDELRQNFNYRLR